LFAEVDAAPDRKECKSYFAVSSPKSDNLALKISLTDEEEMVLLPLDFKMNSLLYFQKKNDRPEHKFGRESIYFTFK